MSDSSILPGQRPRARGADSNRAGRYEAVTRDAFDDGWDLPEAERPTVRVLDTASPRFRTLADAARRAKGADFSVCDIDLPVQVAGAPAPAA